MLAAQLRRRRLHGRRAAADALRRVAEATAQRRAPASTLTVSTTISFVSL
jgi:hypothetical protein